MSQNPWIMGIDSNSYNPQRNMHPRPALPATGIPKKKRRTSGKAAARLAQTAECADSLDVQIQNLCPPPLSCFGDTVSVANPFDDLTPRPSRSAIPQCDLPKMQSHAMGQMNGQPMRVVDRMEDTRATMHHNMGAHMNQMRVGSMPSNGMIGRSTGNRMARPMGTIVHGNDEKPMANNGSETLNGLPWMNDRPFGWNGSQPRHNGMNWRMDSNSTAPMIPTPSSNLNNFGRNSNNMARMPHRTIVRGPIAPFTANGGREHLSGQHPMVLGDNIDNHRGQPHPGTRLTNPAAEKIYQSDQPMIFNPQNRNAPPIYICGACHKEVNDNNQGIVCESGCNFWFHRACVGLTEAAFQLLNEQVFAEWVCDKCLKMKNVPPVKFRT